jgi:hypothetical protein
VGHQTRFRILAGTALPVVLAWAGTLRAQETSVPRPPDQSVASQNGALNIVGLPCVQPLPMVKLQDYIGPLKKTVGLFAQQLERKSVHPVHYKAGLKLCSLELKDKFFLFVRDSFDPIIFLSSGFNAGISQAENDDAAFGQGAAGYGKRFGASFTDQVTSMFFKDFAYPEIFREDPRYYRLVHGSSGKRFSHALEHAVVAHTDNGNRMFNFSEWLGTASAVSLSNVYHPGNKRGFGPSAEGVGFSVLSDMGYDVLREFWPEISRKFKLPFRAEPEPKTEEIDLNPPIN